MVTGGHGSNAPADRQKGREVRFRDPHDALDLVGWKSARLDPAPHGPHRDAEAVGDLLHRVEFREAASVRSISHCLVLHWSDEQENGAPQNLTECE